jgi:FemAB-related protein (PEP-CTERM system-associated)
MTTTVCRCDVGVASVVPDGDAGWMDTLNDPRSQPTLAHAPEWLHVIRDVYGHEPLYLSAQDRAGLRAVLPAFIVRRPFGGAVITSMPYLDSGGPCGHSASLAALLVESLIDRARKIAARSIELRSVTPLRIGVPAKTHKVNLTLELPSNAGTLWQRADKAVRNQVRKAEREGITIDAGGVELLPAFYDVFAARMRDLGSPVHARRFLGTVVEAFGRRARIVLARRDGLTIGGLIAIRFKDRLTVPWAACLERYFPLCPNMLLYWDTLRTACAEEVRHFDFGRSTRGSGTYRFKRQWGAAEEQLFWYTIPLRPQSHAPRRAAERGGDFAVRAWRRLPLAVTRQLGPHIRKYLTQ